MLPAGHGAAEAHDPAAVRYDPTMPIDLSGVEGVTPAQQAIAENLVAAVNVVRLPKWADPAIAEAAGFHSIGDGDGGEEHYVNWDWIDDGVWLDPDTPREPRVRRAAGWQQETRVGHVHAAGTTWRWRTSPTTAGL